VHKSWLLIYSQFVMHGQKNIKFTLKFVKSVQDKGTA